MESRKMVLMNLFAGQEKRCSCRERTCGHSGGRGGWDELRALISLGMVRLSGEHIRL